MSFYIAPILLRDYVASLPLEDVVSEHYQLIYLSRLALDSSVTCVAVIVRSARQRNPMQAIGGLLVFDGERFWQYLEGEKTSVCALAERIRTDCRHTDFRILLQSKFSGPRLLSAPGLEYALCYDGCLDCFEEACGTQAVDLLNALLPRLDMEPKHSIICSVI
ncbi:MAG: BLUF domain-containing protein [Sulfuriferula multivorans]|uniref:BLUF domain-containing protein n=1 Tax=Sulfuriferula multivorans TaxID=1559896 RepID=A0A7C9NT62_9PROT|nr:BLUF domain-containing protein [Sulfuriferula multivorans]